MSTLVYPPPTSRRRLWLVGSWLLVMYAVLVILALRLDMWGPVASSLLVGGVLGYRNWRVRTVVTTDAITVRGLFRTRVLPMKSAKELIDPGRFGDHVLVAPKNGPAWPLPRTVPADAPDIHALTGLKVRAGKRP